MTLGPLYLDLFDAMQVSGINSSLGHGVQGFTGLRRLGVRGKMQFRGLEVWK